MKKKLVPVLIVLFSAVFLFSAFMIFREKWVQEQEQERFEELEKLVAPEEKEPEDIGRPQEGETLSPEEETPARRNLTPLFQRNPDCVGWVYIEGTNVNYPVMHTPEEPQRYLRKNFDREKSTAGVPFLDGSCTLDSDNLIIYGHNMKSGAMFANLTKYKNKDYFRAHPQVELETAEGLTVYRIFAVVRLQSDDDWYFFRNASGEEDFNRKIAVIQKRALYETGITPACGDKLLTLSTCYGADTEERIIVIGVAKEQ